MSFLNKIFTFFFLLTFLLSFSIEKINLTVPSSDEEQEKNKASIEPPKFSRISGFYPDNFKLKLISQENTKIYYTIDSTDPRNSTTSKEFINYIQIYDRSLEPNMYSAIGINASSPVSISSTNTNYEVPNYPVDKAMIIRAVTKDEDGEFSEVITRTYFVTNENLIKYQDRTVISIVTDPKNLFDPDIGIYVVGTKCYEERKKAEGEDGRNRNQWNRQSCNFQMKGKEWERESFVTIFNNGEINLQQKLGIRVKGAYTRTKPAKSFNLFARKDYGKARIETDLLKDNYDMNGNPITSYKSLGLRNIYSEERLRDEYGRDLFYNRKGIVSANMKDAVLFLNGEYWGFYLIQEKIDDHFLSQNYLLPNDYIVVVRKNNIDDGPEEELIEFNYFCGNYSLKNVSNEKVYSEIKEKIDIESFIELFATSIYILHFDWPGNNDGQWKYFGDPIEGNKYSDGKWRFFLYDLDYTMGKDFTSVKGTPNADMFTYIEGRIRRRITPANLFVNLIKNNSDFQNKFVNTICDYANDVYDKEKIELLLERYRDECTDLVANSQVRWSGNNYYSFFERIANYKTNYLKVLDSIINFFEQRPKFIYQNMKEYMGLKGDPVDLTIEIKGRGKVQINSITPNFKNGKWTGKYFSRIPITIKAIPDEGYDFKEWTEYIQSSKQKEEIILFESQNITVIFD